MKKNLLFGSLLCASLFSFAQTNNAISFDGVDDAVLFSKNPLFGLTNFTIEAMVKNENATADADVFIQFWDATNVRFEVRIDNNKLSLYSEVIGLKPISTFSVPLGKFFHMALVKNGQVTKLYADGTEVLTLNGSYSLGSGLRIGRYFNEPFGAFKGQLDEIRLWSVAKTLTEIKAAPTCGLTGTEANLVGYYDFNSGVAGASNTGVTTLTDKSTSKANGTLDKFALTGASSNWVTSDACTELSQNALSFDGVDDAVLFSKNPLFGLTNFTIEAMVKNESTTADADVFIQFWDATNVRFEVRINSGKLALYSEVLGKQPSSTFSVPLGKFFHMALVKNGQVTKLYADGTEVLTLNGSFSLGSGLRIGRYFNEPFGAFKGQLDEIRLWSVAKTLTEIKAAPTCGLTGSEANLVGYYDFNSGVAGASNTGVTTLVDKSTSKANGTLSNFALAGTSSNWVISDACETVVTSIDYTNIQSGISIFPNPATNFIEIKGAENNSVVEIYSATGQKVVSQTLESRIELPATLDAGMYFVHVKGSTTSKHVVIKQ